jgi:Protein of unknown function (DUF3800)
MTLRERNRELDPQEAKRSLVFQKYFGVAKTHCCTLAKNSIVKVDAKTLRLSLMSGTFNLYCDESCHLEHDTQKAMVLGVLWCPFQKIQEASQRIKEIKAKHGLPSYQEIKWTKVSPAKQAMYLELLDYFFDDDDLRFRALIVPNKDRLDHISHHQTHEIFYYKIYFTLLKALFEPNSSYRIYLDIKDTRGGARVRHLHEILCNNQLDFQKKIIKDIQLVRSHEIQLMQLADMLIGAVSYANRDLTGSQTKLTLLERMKKRSGYHLTRSTLLREQKVNIFRWEPQA